MDKFQWELCMLQLLTAHRDDSIMIPQIQAKKVEGHVPPILVLVVCYIFNHYFIILSYNYINCHLLKLSLVKNLDLVAVSRHSYKS